MDKVLNFQLSLFGSFNNVQPNVDLTMKICNSLQGEDFVPGTVQINILEPEAKKVTTETRLQMVSQDKMWTVVFLADRIDVNYAYNGGLNAYRSLTEIFAKVRNICEKSYAPIAATTGTRLALNGQFLLDSMDSSSYERFMGKYLRRPLIYAENPLTEWNVHYNSPTDVKMRDGHLEKCNFIINIGSAYEVDAKTRQPIMRAVTGIDINTPAENAVPKYTYIDLLHFGETVLSTMSSTLCEIEEDKA